MKCPKCGYKFGRLNQVRDEDIKRLYHGEKREPEELSKIYMIGVGRIKQIIGYENLRPNVKNDLRLKRRLAIYADRESGMTFVAIGRNYGISAGRVRQIWAHEKRRIAYRKRFEGVTP